AFLAELDGSCRTPIAGLAVVEQGTIRFRGLILSPDGAQWHDVEMGGPISDAEAIGQQAGKDVHGRAGPEFLKTLM
ncbi:MAG: hydroxymethylbilane synthase, partial [Pseudomonadota bacterium]